LLVLKQPYESSLHLLALKKYVLNASEIKLSEKKQREESEVPALCSSVSEPGTQQTAERVGTCG